MRRFRDETEENDNQDDEDVPLHRKRAFGSGLKRKRVEFVPAKDPDAGISAAAVSKPAIDIGDLYASIVLKDGSSSSKELQDAIDMCPICSLPATTTSGPHEASLAHQVCLTHSHPPSAINRSRMGLRALESQGWDPDARKGLGREGEGMRYPIKMAAKEDTLGIGATVPESVTRKEKEEKPKKLNRKEMRKLAEKEKLRNERLQGEIFGSVDVERYLRGGG